ncbi:6886_t:CDS:2, partial [Paraglomus occultum]
TAQWKGMFVDMPEAVARIHAQQDELQAIKRQYQESQKQEAQKTNTYQVDVPYVVHYQKMRKVTCKIEDEGCQKPYHYKGPDTQCWCGERMDSPKEHCSICVWKIQTCRAITLLPDEVLAKLEKEEKIKPKQQLKPIIQSDAAYPKKWETRGILQARKWTPKAELPTPVHQGFILYSNEDTVVCGQEYVPTGIEIKVPEGMSAMVSSLDNTSSYIIPATLIQTHGRIKVPMISIYGACISARQPIAKLTLLTIAGAQLVAAGQQKESKPSPFTKNSTPDQDAQVKAL